MKAKRGDAILREEIALTLKAANPLTKNSGTLARKILDLAATMLTGALLRHGRVVIPRFGSFEIYEIVRIKTSKKGRLSVRFYPTGALKQEVNREEVKSMRKYGVTTKNKSAGTNTKTAANKRVCPNCGAVLEKNANVAKCPRCGTEPFEKEEEKHGEVKD